MYWNPEVLTRIDAADDLKIAPYHPDMNTTGTPTWIWEVKVDNRLFVRAYSGIRSKWYQAALSQQAGKILAIGQEFDVLFAKPSDPELESKIDQAYLKKYSGSSYVSAILAPAAQVLHQHFGIKHGLMNTTHAYTNSQALHDQPEKDLRGARAAALSIVPYSSGAAKALGKVIPELDGRLTGYSLRVPVPVVSIVDLTVTLERDVTVEEVNNAFREAAAAGPLKGILGYSDEPLVSNDYQGDPRSSIIDGLSTLVIGGNMVKILAWYDNEWGFSNRLVDLALMMAKRES